MLNKVRKYIDKYNMLKQGDRVIVGVSGGADSVCLLNMLCGIREEYGLTIEVVHINHCIRGEAADEDEAYVKELAHGYGCKFHSFSYRVESLAAEKGLTVEEMGRELRYKAFYTVAEEDKIAVAHNMNDNCETMLMRFIRGTGIKGLGGILPVRGQIIRPLLALKRQEIEQYCKQRGLSYHTDSTNLCSDYTRNKLRLELIPELKECFNASLDDTMYRTSELMRAEEEYLNECAVKAYKACLVGDNMLSIDRLSGYGKVIRRRAVRLGFIGFSPDLHDISYEQVESVLSLCDKENGKVIELVHGLRAARENNCLHLYREEVINDYSYRLDIDKECYISEIDTYALLSTKKIEKNVKICYTIALNCDTINSKLLVRNRRAGDKIYLSSINGHKSLKKLMSELRLNRIQRQRQPVLVCGDRLVSVCGYRVDECFTTKDKEAALYFYLYKES